MTKSFLSDQNFVFSGTTSCILRILYLETLMESQNCLMILIFIILGGYVIILGAYVLIFGAYSIIFGA